MKYFDYDATNELAEYYALLQFLMEAWESEIVEFKEASGQYSTDKIGQYFSAISNEANLKGQQYGWFILGVSEKGTKHITGTNFKQGDQRLLENFKYEVSKNTTDGISFMDIIELAPSVESKSLRVLMFKIPAAATGMPTEWKNRCYAREGESLLLLQQYKIDQIRGQSRRDWSKQIVSAATIECLDQDAIALARAKYKEKMNNPYIAEEVDGATNAEFLTKTKLLLHGQITNAALVLLGKSEQDFLLDSVPKIMWRLYDANGKLKDYELFSIPFISVVDKIFAKVRNLSYRYMPDQSSLFPRETQQYDTWLLRELLNNCIAHSNYQLGGRIYINEFDDKIELTNPGDFIPKTIENVLSVSYNPPFYRNQLLSDAMVFFHMIDTAGNGIKTVYRIQKAKFFPMPDYDFATNNQVGVTVYGKTIDDKYTYMLFKHQELPLETVYLLDQVQKGNGAALPKEAVKYLRQHKLIEGRKSNLYLSAEVSQSIAEEAQYIKNKGFNDQYYKDMIINYLRKYRRAKKKDLRSLIWDKLPDVLTDKQKNNKLTTLLTALRKKSMIKTSSANQQQSYWVLVK